MLKIFLLQVAIICGGSGKYVIFVTVYRVAVLLLSANGVA